MASADNESLKKKYEIEFRKVLRGESKSTLVRLYNGLVSIGERPDMIEVVWLGESYKAEMLGGKIKVKSCGKEKENSGPKKRELAVKSKNDALEHDTYKVMEGVDVAALQAKINKLCKVNPAKEATQKIG